GPGLRAWAGDGSVLLLDEDPATGTLLLERLDAERPLSSVPSPLRVERHWCLISFNIYFIIDGPYISILDAGRSVLVC
ncbi:MAG TPA: hypothetical protein VM347_20440, partial [Nonomuraea sp.]|nr:hypothetical protein [Nonomuraea sp.]